MAMKKIIALLMAITSMLAYASCKGNEPREMNDISIRETYTREISTTEMYRINGKLKPVNSYTALEREFISTLPEKGYVSTAIFDASELTTEMLESRTPEVVIIERCISIVTNANEEGDGKMLNYDGGYYIKHDKGIEDGTIMLTYFIYNPNTQYYDDIIERYDFVLDTEYAD